MATEFEIALALKDSRLISITEPAVMRAHQALAYLIWDQQRLGQSTTKEEIRLVDGAERTHSSTISANPNCSIHLLELLAKDKESDVRSIVAKNPSCPVHLLELLAKDEDRWIRHRVAENPSCPVHLLELLAKDEDRWNRKSIAEYVHTPVRILEYLYTEPKVNDYDEKKIKSVLQSPEQLSKLRADYLKKLCAGLNPSFSRVYGLLLSDCSPAVLTKCAKSTLWLERCAVAQNPLTSTKLLQVLAKDSNALVAAAAQRA